MQGDFQAPQITEVRNPGSAQPYCGVAGAVCVVYALAVWSAAAVVNYAGAVNVAGLVAGLVACVAGVKGC
ncbi:hypothetical protein MX629_08195 [Carnobacterium divergens]|uniref:Uncharacterized protein n=1 Tax=Carnobacterium divergens TaxID=2748 RepID=A0AAW8R9X4_CARDV|nr:hypothetical protein [Carnobacterium divergens]MDT1958398.1 hypothetical protein [Carnobacterium divergens]MDT1974247.1 hypothetical protein [Carnobacterium divergens]